VTISYNQAAFLEEAILSVLSQDYADLEYIVVDAGSSDGSRDVIETYRKQIDKVIFEPDNGPADGLNKGFQLASGEIFGYLNADDILLPNTVSQVARAFLESPNATVISGHGILIDAHGQTLRKIYSHRFDLRGYAYGACVLVQPASFFRKDAFFQVGGFNVLNRVSWDGELWVDLALLGVKFSRMHSYLAKFRMHGSSVTGSGEYDREIQTQHVRICQKIGIHPQSKLKRTFLWALNRLSDPKTTAARLLDGFTNPPFAGNKRIDLDSPRLLL
jgi:glycosyltransferase involved in cell wall biosynthesis